MIKVLYVNHKQQQCGVYEFGKSIGKAILNSKKFNIRYCECDSYHELKTNYSEFHPQIIIYNYHPSTMQWVFGNGRFDMPVTYKLNAIHIGTIHEVYQQVADEANDKVFDFHIAPDPTLMLKNQIVFKTGRLLPKKPTSIVSENAVPIIGSFGFATGGKGFDKIVRVVQDEFDHAIIKLNIPYAKFGDESGDQARKIAQECQNLLFKKSIILNIDHTYLSDSDLLSFLASNSLNVFFYDDMENRGISSATDWAIACGRPLAISKSRLFRHLFSCRPSICMEENSLQQIIKNGTAPLLPIWDDWSEGTIIWDYERILSHSLKNASKSRSGKRNGLRYYAKKLLRKFGYLKEVSQIKFNQWTKSDDEFNYKLVLNKIIEPFNLSESSTLNRILDDEARMQFKPAIKFLEQHLPVLISKKIPEANIQQAFVLDTTIRLAKKFNNPRILAVGSFEDTAVEGLKLLNYNIDCIDPILNYDLETYISKPSVREASYDIIISTSVIEHVDDDGKFLKDIAYLLKKNGFGILTCDYNDQYKQGDDIPVVDYRFYTQHDIKNRLLTGIPNCLLADTPKWDCINPDFLLAGRYRYTFASIVFIKK